MKSMSADAAYSQIIEEADNIYNAQVNLFEIGDNTPDNI